MSAALYMKFKALEARVAELEKKLDQLSSPAATPARSMCPKCGVKPNHFFHVKNCRGPQEEQKNGDDGRGTSNPT